MREESEEPREVALALTREYIERISEVLSQAENLSESLADLGYGFLREGFTSHDQSSLGYEKEVAKARRSVEKAVHVLRTLERKLDQD